MKTVGIDSIAFYTSHYYIDLHELARARNVDPDKYTIGLGQEKMAISAPDEDIVTMAANAAAKALKDIDVTDIDTFFFATESGIDQAKAAGTYVHRLLNLPKNCRIAELKQACYSATFALQMACAWVMQNPTKKALIIASDIAKYGLGTAGESSQGCGACAMVISKKPRILVIEPGQGLFSEDVMDFWRPNYREEALVDGKYSSLVYLRSLEQSFDDFVKNTKRKYSDMDYFLFHTPIPKLVEKAFKHLSKKNNVILTEGEIKQKLSCALNYPKIVGNTYTAALYISLCSLLDNDSSDLSNKRIGFYSYGSGCVAEYFSGIVQKGYQKHVNTAFHQNLLNARKALTCEEYEKYYSFKLPHDGSEITTDSHTKGEFRLTGIKNHQRQYESLMPIVFPQIQPASKTAVDPEKIVTAISPGKIILSGDHSVVYGCPAIAFAVDRYARTTITPQLSKMISFNLFSSRYRDSFPIETLREARNLLSGKYQQFLQGKLGIRDVLKTPMELASYTFANFFEHLNAKFANGFDIATQSDIPVGCGMGSSAAVILTVLRAVAGYFGIYVNEEKYYQLGLDAERLQHGYSSGLDVFTSLHGGCIHFENGKTQIRSTPDFPMFLVNTGHPESITGECVAEVKSQFENSTIWESFRDVTNQFDQAIQSHQFSAIQTLIKENHRLLCDIGVVPKKVQQFISDIEKAGCAAKICGAGSVRGDNAGIVLITAENKKQILPVCQKYQFEPFSINIVQKGLHVA